MTAAAQDRGVDILWINASAIGAAGEAHMHLAFWNDLLQLLEGSLPRDAISLWILPLRPLLLAEDKFVIETPNVLHAHIVQTRYLEVLRRCARVLSRRPLAIDFVTAEIAAEPPARLPAASPRRVVRASRLNPRYTFENFILGRCNRAAATTARAAAERPGRRNNPLFITGSVGLGKTHLLQAIGAHALARSEHSCICLPSERLMDELTEAYRERTIERARAKLASARILLVDDIHFLSGRNQMQEEFFHIFSTLHGKRCQVVLTSDRPPKEIPRLHARLLSRFESGSLVELTAPSLITRITILEQKARLLGLALSREILVLLASRITTNIRRMEGALNAIAARAAVSGAPPTKETAERILAEGQYDGGGEMITIACIQKRVAAHFQIRLAALLGRTRSGAVVHPRQLAMYLCRTLIGMPYADIGAAFSDRDHTTALHAWKMIEELRRSNTETRQALDELVTAIRS